MQSGSASEELRFDFDAKEPVSRVATGSRASNRAGGRAPLTDRVVDEAPEDEFDDDEFGDPEPASEESLTVAQFYDRVRRALAREFLDEVWVTGEIRGLRESRGHRYLELADHDGGTTGRAVAQQLEVVCWSREWPRIAVALDEAGVNLEVGRVVRVRGKVSVWEGGSKLRFTLTALDVEALLGGIAAARHRLLVALAAEGLLEANRRLALPLVPLRIGLVTSPGTEAHRDFLGQLKRSGFAFTVHLEPSLVQGTEAPGQLGGALHRLAALNLDLAVIVRGGGARGDLAAFDSEVVARAIALAPFPIWTGIGHTGDRSVADEVAQRALITPTACGEAVVAEVAAYWEGVLRQATTLASLARARLDTSTQQVTGARDALSRCLVHQLDRRCDELQGARSSAVASVRRSLERELGGLAQRRALIGRAARQATASEEQHARRRREVLGAYDPRRQLERGWTLSRDGEGRLVRSVRELRVGQQLTTRFADGDISALVDEVVARVGADRGSPGQGDASR